MNKFICLSLLLCLFSCSSRDDKKQMQKGAGIGAAVGAVAGSIVSKDKKQGAIIGGFLGGVAGGAYGKKLDDQAKELEKVAETERTDQGIITKLKGDITFETGRSSVREDAKERIDKIADILKKYPENKITVVGHTDSTGPTSLNDRLSEDRAESVKDLLVKNGVKSSSIVTLGVADRDPIASNETAKGREANRRVELAITMEADSENQRRSE